MQGLRFTVVVLFCIAGLGAEVVVTTAAFVALVLLPFLLAGCPVPPVCSPAETRCMADAERAEVCDPSGQWVLVADCNVVGQQSGGRWVCQETDEGHACLPLEAPQ